MRDVGFAGGAVALILFLGVPRDLRAQICAAIQFAKSVIITIDSTGDATSADANGNPTKNFACVQDKGTVTFKLAQNTLGTFRATFRGPHPFQRGHYIHEPGTNDKDDLVDAKGDGGSFNYRSCYHPSGAPKVCVASRIIVQSGPTGTCKPSQFDPGVTITIDSKGKATASYGNGGSKTDGFACVEDPGTVTFVPAKPEDEFSATFGNSHPFPPGHEFHGPGTFDVNEPVSAALNGGSFKYRSCYRPYSPEEVCVDPKIIVRQVPRLFRLSPAFAELKVIFPDQQKGTPGVPIAVTVQNDWSSPVTSVEVRKDSAGQNSGDVEAFNLTTNCNGLTLGANESCVITVTFQPTKEGSQTQSTAIVVSYQGTEPNQSQRITVSGKGL